MTNDKLIRLSKLAREFNVGVSTLVEFLHKKGHNVSNDPNAKVDQDLLGILSKEFGAEVNLKKESQKVSLKGLRDKKESISIDDVEKEVDDDSDFDSSDDEVIIKTTTIEHPKSPEIEDSDRPKIDLKLKGKIDLDALAPKKSQPTPPVEKKEEVKQVEKPKPQPQTEEKPKHKEHKPAPVEHIETSKVQVEQPKVLGKIDLKTVQKPTRPESKPHDKPKHQEPRHEKKVEHKQPVAQPKVEEPKVEAPAAPVEEQICRSEVEKLTGPTIMGKIDLSAFEPKKKPQPVASSNDANGGGSDRNKKKKRKRIKKENAKVQVPEAGQPVQRDPKQAPIQLKKADPLQKQKGNNKKKKPIKQEVDEEAVQRQIKETLARLTSKGKTKGSKYRREKRDLVNARQQQEQERIEQEMKILKVTEFVSVNELATMMDVAVTEVIEVCMNLGLMVSINQRLDAETMALVADEFGYQVEFVSVDLQEAISTEAEDTPDKLKPRSPIVTVMGHVDHGKTSLLDYIRHANVIAGEAGGITQHIGAYGVILEDGRKITFLDTPGHEAFTAMRARGAKLTDIAIIVVAADDAVMPQTIEAINHASAAGVPIIFAINKIDKPTADAEKIKGELANMNYLVEDWGGKYQCQEISAKKGLNIDKLLEKVLLEAEMLDLKANPDKRAQGTVVESALDKGRGYVSTVLIESGTLRQGDIMIAGVYYGHVKAMFNERGTRIHEAGPASPVQVIGLNGAPQAGDYFNVMETDKEAKEIANKREQLQRMQGLKTKKHITLDEIGRRIAIGNFQELNIVVKGDVDGSIEALSDALIKLSTPQIQVNVIHKAVGQISESDILLAAASNAIVIGFQVRPSVSARKLAEKEEIDIRLYSIIYDATNEIKDAMEGMLSPEIKEEITGTAEVLDVFKITKVGSVAGCIVREGKLIRNNKVRLIRDGIVVYTGDLGSLKRFKDDVKEVTHGFECGLNINNFNDIKVGDIVEGFQQVEVKRKL
ncbi:MAG TPA: translation initiation factor IF-2 [Tenuifilaceae bacterium]|nr:translation initiation factor IF-2 [Tenuifilaceae bacterium]HPI44046.1 translation initiation factor IF-2 [Tenuifilaceae bacterium]